MRTHGLLCVLAIFCSITPPILSESWAVATPPSPTTSQQVTSLLMGTPLQFEANHGQVDAQVQFLSRGKGYTLFLTPTESVMVLQQREVSAAKAPLAMSNPTALPTLAPIKQAVVRMKLEGANHSPAAEGMEQLPGIVNYFIGSDQKKWHRDIPTYAKVQYQQAYLGIDLVYYGNQGRLEYDFIVAPGADPDQIKLSFEGASEIMVADSGDLVLTTALGEVRMQKPVVYQLEADGHKTLVAGQYHIAPEGRVAHHRQAVGFKLAAYDQHKPVVIDPVLLFSTLLGGNGNDAGSDIARDVNGNLYVSGVTNSTDFLLVNPMQSTYGGNVDVFVTKFNSTGVVQFSTYLGGNFGDSGGVEGPSFYLRSYSSPGIAVDSVGNAYVAGTTQSTDFPTLNAYQASIASGNDAAFVTKLGPTGALVYSTYLGGTCYGLDIAVDTNQNAYVTGQAFNGFPVGGTTEGQLNSGNMDAFVTKFNATGGLVYSRFLGGSGFDGGRGIAADSAGNVYLIGDTNSDDFPDLNASQPSPGAASPFNFGDAFVAKLDPQGVRLWATFLGGNQFEYGRGIAVDESGNVYVTGETNSADFPTLNANQPTSGGITNGAFDAFVVKYTSTGERVYATYLGGNTHDAGSGIAADSAGNAYVTGQTASADFPILNASQPVYGGAIGPEGSSNTQLGDAFVSKLSAAGVLLYSTYLGGGGFERGFGIAVDGSGTAYVTGYIDGSPDFPLVNPTYSSLGGVNAFLAKLGEPSTNQSPVCNVAQANPDTLWTPDGTFVPIVVTGVTDPDGDSVTITVTSVTQDEPVKGKSDKTSPDAVIQAGSSSVRAERLNSGNGRVYQISFTADDGNGSSCTGAVTIGVPLSLRRGLAAIDDGQAYDSTVP